MSTGAFLQAFNLRKTRKKQIKGDWSLQGQISSPCLRARMTSIERQDLQLSISAFLFSLALQLIEMSLDEVWGRLPLLVARVY